MNNPYVRIFRDGMWSNNQALVALLGLCPLLAVSNTVINGLGMGLATLLTLVVTNFAVSSIRSRIRHEIRIPIFVLVIASAVTVIELSMKAYFFDLYKILGIFVPLIVTNCSIIARAEAYAYKNPVARSVFDGFSVGLGFTLALVLLGAMRELAGYGTLLRQADLMFGAGASELEIVVLEEYRGFLLAILPAGAFFGLSLLVAGKNGVDRLLTLYHESRRAKQSALSTDA